MGSMEGGGAPLLNDYKLEFFWKRFPQTVVGGLKLKLGYDAPLYVYVNQVVVFLFPFLLGGLFTFVAEFSVTSDVTCSYIYGGLVTVLVLSTKLVSWLIRRRPSGLAKLQRNALAQDDEIDFISCCGVETVQFIFPANKFAVNVIIHCLISGLLCGLMFLYLLPSSLNNLYSNTGATIVLFTLGWWTVCTAQYSLTSAPPPELASFRALDTLEINSLMRPFYVLLFGITGALTRHYSELVSVDKALHILFPFLPLLWIMGILPPLDALLPWLAEQALVLVLGGSPLSTDLRLLVMLILSSLTVVMATFIHNDTVAIILSACFGYILSTDIFGLFLQTWRSLDLRKTGRSKHAVAKWNWKETIVYIMMFALTAGTSAVSKHFSLDASFRMFNAFGFVFVAFTIIVKVLGDVQCVTIFIGLFRNPLYPRSIESAADFKKKKKYMRFVGLVRQLILVYVSPLLLVAFLSMFLAPKTLNLSRFAVAIGTVRALRQVWQNTSNSLLEVSVVCLTASALGTNVASWWATAGLGLQLMLVGAFWNRLQQLFDKVVFMATLAVTSWTLPKQRHRSTVPILISSVLLMPLVLALLGAATVLAAPVLPLFCLPLFLVGFPRPLRSWPAAASTAAANCADSVYYKQLTPQIEVGLGVTMAMGTLGNPAVGDHYLVRFQDRLIWIHVLEVGYRFCSVVIKGLELQETSCHAVEATRVDDVFQDLLVHEGKWPLVSLNQHLGNVLRPCDALVVNTYSDAKNVLTGVIDQPENLRKNSENFLKTLIWVFVRYCKDRKFETKEDIAQPALIKLAEQNVAQPTDVLSSVKPKESPLMRLLSQDDIELENLPGTLKQQTSIVGNPKRRRSGSLPSLSDSVWSQESLKLDESLTSQGKRQKSFGSAVQLVSDEGIEDLDKSFNLGGFPALDVGRPLASKDQDSGAYGRDPFLSEHEDTLPSWQVNNSKTAPAGNGTMKSAVFTSEHAHRLDLPPWWKFSIPVDRQHTDSFSAQFPLFWLKHAIKCLDFGLDSQTIAESINSDSVLIGLYRELTCACYAVVEVWGFPGSSGVEAGPGHVFKVYSGDLPWSTYLDWLDKNADLKLLVLKAYRYAFKLTYDEAVLGEVSSEDELAEYLMEYDRDWYLGKETDHQWQLAVMENKPSLFSLGRDKDKGTYTSRVLTNQEIMAPVGRLNGECVRGQWASLALELLYFTNDDEERYSIQAHPTLLRNLTIQAADPPLGYPVYSSGAVSVSLTVPPL